MNLQKIFLSFFGSGYAPKAPGTIGTLASMPLGLLILYYMGEKSLFTITFVITVIGILEVNKYENSSGSHDDSWIVIDETAGVWLTMVITYQGFITHPTTTMAILAVTLSFFSFRLFDIWKPSTIGWIDRNLKGGLGVMLDDTLAGIAAGLLNLLIIKGVIEALY